MPRREFLALGAAMAAVTGAVRPAVARDGADMYGLIGKMTALAGKRDELIAILLAGVARCPVA